MMSQWLQAACAWRCMECMSALTMVPSSWMHAGAASFMRQLSSARYEGASSSWYSCFHLGLEPASCGHMAAKSSHQLWQQDLAAVTSVCYGHILAHAENATAVRSPSELGLAYTDDRQKHTGKQQSCCCASIVQSFRQHAGAKHSVGPLVFGLGKQQEGRPENKLSVWGRLHTASCRKAASTGQITALRLRLPIPAQLLLSRRVNGQCP